MRVDAIAFAILIGAIGAAVVSLTAMRALASFVLFLFFAAQC